MTPARARAKDGRTNLGLPSPALLATLFLGVASLPAAQLSVGSAREDITPPSGFRDWATKDQNFEGVISPLYARAVVVSDGCEPPTLDALRAHVSRTLDATAAPRELHIVEALPRHGIGKVDRMALVRRFAGAGDL